MINVKAKKAVGKKKVGGKVSKTAPSLAKYIGKDYSIFTPNIAHLGVTRREVADYVREGLSTALLVSKGSGDRIKGRYVTGENIDGLTFFKVRKGTGTVVTGCSIKPALPASLTASLVEFLNMA